MEWQYVLLFSDGFFCVYGELGIVGCCGLSSDAWKVLTRMTCCSGRGCEFPRGLCITCGTRNAINIISVCLFNWSSIEETAFCWLTWFQLWLPPPLTWAEHKSMPSFNGGEGDSKFLIIHASHSYWRSSSLIGLVDAGAVSLSQI